MKVTLEDNRCVWGGGGGGGAETRPKVNLCSDWAVENIRQLCSPLPRRSDGLQIPPA